MFRTHLMINLSRTFLLYLVPLTIMIPMGRADKLMVRVDIIMVRTDKLMVRTDNGVYTLADGACK